MGNTMDTVKNSHENAKILVQNPVQTIAFKPQPALLAEYLKVTIDT